MKLEVPFFSFDYRNETIREEAIKSFIDFFDSKWYVLGKSTEKFEQAYAKYSNTNYCVGLSSGLDALHMALLALGIGEGDEVIVPSNTYIATVLSVTYTGAKPVFVEPRMETANIDPTKIRQAITPRTKCIMPVHLYGQPCEMVEIMKVAKEFDLHVVEDNAQAHGATLHGQITGSFGIVNATSFYPTKNLGALGEAGAVTTNEEELADKIKSLRNYGSHQRYYNDVIGFNNRIDEFEAAYLCEALKHMDKWTTGRIKIAHRYVKGLSKVNGVTLMDIVDGAESVYHLFVVRCAERDQLREFLAERGIGTQIHYPVPPHLQKAYKHLGFVKGDYPIAERLASESLSLPVWPGMSNEQVDYVIDNIEAYFKR